MRRVPNKKNQIIFRTLVLCLVLCGLLFSCGEGIRLFPFPATETSKNDSVHRFEDRQGNHKTKSQRGSQHHYWIENGKLNNSAFLISKTRQIFNHSFAAENLKLPFFSESGESRAPPFII
jgi:hypothetical protein